MKHCYTPIRISKILARKWQNWNSYFGNSVAFIKKLNITIISVSSGIMSPLFIHITCPHSWTIYAHKFVIHLCHMPSVHLWMWLLWAFHLVPLIHCDNYQSFILSTDNTGSKFLILCINFLLQNTFLYSYQFIFNYDFTNK